MGSNLAGKLRAGAGNLRLLLQNAEDARKVLPIAFLLMLTFLAAMAWDGISSTRELLASQAEVNHSHQVLHEMEGVEDGLQDAREAWLHYVLTPERQDRDNFNDAVSRVWQQVAKAKALTQKDAALSAKISQLEGWINEELKQLSGNLQTKETLKIYHSEAADFRRDRVRRAILEFKSEEEKLLHDRNEATQIHAREINRSVTVRITGFSVLMAALFVLVMRDSRKLRVAEQTALLSQTRLETSLQQLQIESEGSRLLNDLQSDLQICASPSEAYEVVAGHLEKLIPDSNGDVFAIESARNLMAVIASWGAPGLTQSVWPPEDCCAVRAGGLHTRMESPRGLTCRHFAGGIPPAYICLPMVALGETLGVLHISAPSSAVFTPGRLALIQKIGEYAALRLANLRLRDKLHDQSIRDPLTGLYNRRYMEATLEQELHRSTRRHTGLGVIMADIDKFKACNDTFGHDAGDYVLKEISALLRRSVRASDIVCRYGGEEFLIVLPDSSPESVREKAAQMCTAVAELKLEHAGRSLGRITASLGISYSQDGALKTDDLMRSADQALYDAKRQGCNRVCESESLTSQRAPASPAPEPAPAPAPAGRIKLAKG
jgi:diguanylate cyclase (GGDEF)-like protein